MSFLDPYADVRPRGDEAPPGFEHVLVRERVYLPAGIGRRFAAALIDLAWVHLVMVAVTLLIMFGGRRPLPPAEAVGLVTYLVLVGTVAVMFGPATWKAHGLSVGKRLLRLRVVNADGTWVSFNRAMLREGAFRTVPLLLAFPLGLLPSMSDLAYLGVGAAGLWLAAHTSLRRAPWDRVAGTVVVYDRPLPLREPHGRPEPVALPCLDAFEPRTAGAG